MGTSSYKGYLKSQRALLLNEIRTLRTEKEALEVDLEEMHLLKKKIQGEIKSSIDIIELKSREIAKRIKK